MSHFSGLVVLTFSTKKSSALNELFVVSFVIFKTGVSEILNKTQAEVYNFGAR